MSKTTTKNGNLHKAKTAKNDEFYTMLADIERECRHYREFFRGKTVYCNCDDARESNFFRYFSLNFEFLGLKKLICTGYKKGGRGVCLVYEGDKNGNHVVDDNEIAVTELEGNGDFRSEECVRLLDEADVVVTNPPFSLFREYIAQLVEHGKKFLIVGPKNAITYKEIFPLIKDNKMWLGYQFSGGNAFFRVVNPTDYVKGVFDENTGLVKFRNCGWFTNIHINRLEEQIDLYRRYSPLDYPKYDNYDAIEVSKVANIPMDYDGVMGVPITFLDRYCPKQFEIVGLDRYVKDNPRYGHRFTIDSKEIYARILIHKK